MQRIDIWMPSKFIVRNNKLEVNTIVSNTSKRMSSFIAMFYTAAINTYAKGKLLDLGCGTVPFYAFYKDKVESIICSDWEQCLHDSSHIDTICDLNKTLPFESNSFDTIILSDVLEHLVDPKATLTEINRILKKGGCLIFNTPFMYGINEPPHDYYRLTKYAIRNITEQLNMTIVLEEEYGGFLALFEHTLLRGLKKLVGGKYLAALFSKIFDIIFSFKKSNKNNTAHSHPYMYGYVLSSNK